jgi:hypothetical protein
MIWTEIAAGQHSDAAHHAIRAYDRLYCAG